MEKKYNDSARLGIKAWAVEDRPREKMLHKGREVLTNAELIAILIGSGTVKLSAVEVAKKIMAGCENNLNVLSKKTIKDLCKYQGIGPAKAISIVAALEMGRRRQKADVLERKQIKSSHDGFAFFQPIIGDLPHEEFWMLILDRSNKIMGSERVSIGGVAGTVADVKVIFKKALDCLASAIIISHNHPSGSLRPSEADKALTKKVYQAGKVLDISVLDHLIVTDNGYFSFADEGLLG